MFAAILVVIFLLHLPLLQLPYFWDEAGYYIPAARDVLLTGSLIPHTTVSNAHPPLVMLWLALWWKIAGYAPAVTRSAMLFLAAFALLGVFRLANAVSNREVALASTVCTALYPVFFAQSSLAQVDLAAAGFSFWGLAAFVEGRGIAIVFWFALAGLAKETAIIAPVALAAYEVCGYAFGRYRHGLPDHRSDKDENGRDGKSPVALGNIPLLLASVIPLAIWYGYHYLRMGYVFGNPEYVRYNVLLTVAPLRFVLAFLLRLWQLFGYMHLWVLTLAALLALWMLVPEQDSGSERRAIAPRSRTIFGVVIAAYVLAMSLIGGAVLARYMLPAIPLTIILFVSVLWRRLRDWVVVIAFVGSALVAGWFWNPPYGFAPEDNLAYRDYVVLHQNAEQFLEARYPMARVLSAWPASDEIARPWLGYVTRPMQAERIENFTLDQLVAAAGRFDYDVVLMFSTKYEPPPAFWDRWQPLARLRERWKAHFFGYHHDLPPAAASRILGARIVYSERLHGQWIAVLEMERPQEALNSGAQDF